MLCSSACRRMPMPLVLGSKIFAAAWPQTSSAHRQQIRQCNSETGTVTGIYQIKSGRQGRRGQSIGWWGRKGAKAGYPQIVPQRPIGDAENLQERLDDIFKDENEDISERVDIGFAPRKQESMSRSDALDLRRRQRTDARLERAARLRTLQVDLKDVKAEHEACGALFRDIRDAADAYGVFEDLFGKYAVFTPCIKLDIRYCAESSDVSTPVHRGNVVKPSEAANAPEVAFPAAASDSLWTIVLTNPDGDLGGDNGELLHWMVGNIPGDRVSSGVSVCDYMRPLPPFGTGYHRLVFVLYRQTRQLDFTELQRRKNCNDLRQRTFSTSEFYLRFEADLTPAGLAFFQSDYDSSLTSFFHGVLDMAEPRYEYEFLPEYIPSWSKMFQDNRAPFNLFLERYREPSAIQEEVLLKKLAETHPFSGSAAAASAAAASRREKYPLVHLHERHRSKRSRRARYNWDHTKWPEWRWREREREILRQGIYKDMDWNELRRDPDFNS